MVAPPSNVPFPPSPPPHKIPFPASHPLPRIAHPPCSPVARTPTSPQPPCRSCRVRICGQRNPSGTHANKYFPAASMQVAPRAQRRQLGQPVCVLHQHVPIAWDEHRARKRVHQRPPPLLLGARAALCEWTPAAGHPRHAAPPTRHAALTIRLSCISSAGVLQAAGYTATTAVCSPCCRPKTTPFLCRCPVRGLTTTSPARRLATTASPSWCASHQP
eukprot:351849-Chlamydomonas_euryale.AAC.3